MGTVTIGGLWFPRLVSQWALDGEGTFPHPTSSSIWLSGELSLPQQHTPLEQMGEPVRWIVLMTSKTLDSVRTC